MSITHERAKQRRAKIAKFCRSNSAGAAATKFGVSVSTVRNACLEHRVRPMLLISENNVGHVSSFEILRKLLDGESGSAIARDYRVSRQYIYQIKIRAIKAGFFI